MKTIDFKQIDFIKELGELLGFEYIDQNGICAGLCDIYMYYVMEHEAKGEDNKYKDFIDYLNSKLNANNLHRIENVAKIINYFQDYANSGFDTSFHHVNKILLEQDENKFYDDIKNNLSTGKFFHVGFNKHGVLIAQDASGKYRYFDPNTELSYNMSWEELETKLKAAVERYGLNENKLSLEDAKYRIEKYLGSENQKQAKKDVRDLTSIVAKDTRNKEDDIAITEKTLNKHSKNLMQAAMVTQKHASLTNVAMREHIQTSLTREKNAVAYKNEISQLVESVNKGEIKTLDLTPYKGLRLKTILDGIKTANVESIIIRYQTNKTDVDLLTDFIKNQENIKVKLTQHGEMNQEEALYVLSKIKEHPANFFRAGELYFYRLNKQVQQDKLVEIKLSGLSTGLQSGGFNVGHITEVLKSAQNPSIIETIKIDLADLTNDNISLLKNIIKNKSAFSLHIGTSKMNAQEALYMLDKIYNAEDKRIDVADELKSYQQELKLSESDIIPFPKLNQQRILGQTSNFKAKAKECTEKYMTEPATCEITKDHLRMGLDITTKPTPEVDNAKIALQNQDLNIKK